MKGTLSRLTRYKAFNKMVISYFVLILISVSLLSGVLFSLFSARVIKEINRNARLLEPGYPRLRKIHRCSRRRRTHRFHTDLSKLNIGVERS